MRTRPATSHRSRVARTALFAAMGALALLTGGAYLLLPASPSQDAIRSSVSRELALVETAWRLPVASTFGQTLAWQSNGSRCGPASLVNVFRSLGETTRTEGDVLAGTGRCWTGFCIPGLTLDELAEVARSRPGRKVTLLRDLTPEGFRAHLREANNPKRRYIINFSREHIFGSGVGHHSPIGGYLEGEDLVFVLDVNRHYGPWLVERKRLFSAMDTLDGDAKRGLLLIE